MLIRKAIIVFLFSFSFTVPVFSQTGKFEIDHKFYLRQLTGAKDTLYKNILKNYEQQILEHPTEYEIHLEKCRLIQTAYYDSYEDYNPNYDLAKSCSESLVKLFPDTPEVLLYKTEFLYGDSLLNYLVELEQHINTNEVMWQGYSWKVYDQLSGYYSQEENDDKVIHYGKLASQNNDTLDISILLAESYKRLSKNNSAVDVLMTHMDSTNESWNLNRKGLLLLELGEPTKAMEAFLLAGKKDSEGENKSALARAMVDNGLIEEARPYLLDDYKNSGEWGRDAKLEALLKYDLKYGKADSAKLNYQRLTEDNFLNDPFAVYRIRLLFKSPFAGWSIGDIGRILFLILLLCIPFILPYLWILPIYHLGNLQRKKGWINSDRLFHWGLRYFWIACSFVILSELLAYLIVDYSDLVASLNDRSSSEIIPPVSKQVATKTVLFFTFNLLFSVTLLSKTDIGNFWTKLKTNARLVGVGIGLAFALRFGMAAYTFLLRQWGVDFDSGTSALGSINESIMSINEFYNPLLGFLFVVVFVPFYEEIIFRGVFLSACSNQMKFIVANMLQSLMFALVHQNIKYFPFYFVFGMIAGHYTRSTGTLITSTSMHMMNNLMAFLYILSQGK